MSKSTLDDIVKEMREKLDEIEQWGKTKWPVEPESKRWRAEEGIEYWFVNSVGALAWDIEGGNDIDDYRYAQRNYFRTDQEAKDYRKYLDCVAKIRDSATLKPDWGDDDEYKHFVNYNHVKSLYIDYTSWLQYNTLAYYKNEYDVEQAIKDLEEEYKFVFKYEREVLHG